MKNPKVGDGRKNNTIDRAKTGRKKGTPNKMTADVREMLLTALEKAGGVDYLVKQSVENPASFNSLIARVIPKEVAMNITGTKLRIIDLEGRYERD